MDYTKALKQLQDEGVIAGWCCGEDYDSIVVMDGYKKPSLADLDAAWLRYKNDYQRLRAAEYPSWQDQLDDMYHLGFDGWKAKIKAIKDKHPKPE